MSRTWTDPLTSYFSETPLQKNNSISHLFTTRDNQKLLSLSGKSIVIIIKKYAAKPHRKEEEKEEDLLVTLAKAVSPRESFPPGMRGKWSPGAFIVSGWCVSECFLLTVQQLKSWWEKRGAEIHVDTLVWHSHFNYYCALRAISLSATETGVVSAFWISPLRLNTGSLYSLCHPHFWHQTYALEFDKNKFSTQGPTLPKLAATSRDLPQWNEFSLLSWR